ncbi:DNA polymerase kappa [Fusarium oxysporum f. sp. albedinis]|nr:DNA polymerase kappa [Fusarium oxysporum f. sp. albedinis]
MTNSEVLKKLSVVQGEAEQYYTGKAKAHLREVAVNAKNKIWPHITRPLPATCSTYGIGGSIGVGFFVGIGGVLPKAGPLSVFLGYLTWGLFYVWPLDLCVPDMMAYLRVSGSIFELASRYVDPALGFAMSWTYFYAGVMLVCVEYAAIATIMTFWESGVNPAAWIVMTIAVCFILDMVAVQYYGEAEFVMASMKILLLFGLVLLTIITMCGGNPRHDAYGFLHWKNGNAMHSYYVDGTLGRFCG